jgi:hypothetical protein
MFNKISESKMHSIRVILTMGWLLLIGSLFYDPISPWLTRSVRLLKPLAVNPALCIKEQSTCLVSTPYLGASLFWSLIVPISIFILVVFGHEAWRRICPLSFLSQIPRALGWQRQEKRIDPTTGKTRSSPKKVNKESWLGRYSLYLQFGLFYLGLCSRLLFINADRTALGLWLLGTIVAAIAVGYLYDGKSWCQYICPMAPVQTIFAEPVSLFTSKAHTEDSKSMTQSMCRTVKQNQEQSACVACQSGCIDIDAEKVYWDNITKPGQQFLYYGYLGLVVGFFLYHYLYAGNWEYYFSGVWARESNQLAELFHPGFYIWNHPLPLPKLVSVPLFLGASAWLGYSGGIHLERCYKRYLHHNHALLSPEEIQHRLFTCCKLAAFHVFFLFAGRPLINKLPGTLQMIYGGILLCVSGLWFYKSCRRSPERYVRERLASRFRKQLLKRDIDLHEVLQGRSVSSLSSDDVYRLAKALPGFDQNKSIQIYRAVLQEMIDELDDSLANRLMLLQLTLHREALSFLISTQIDYPASACETTLPIAKPVIRGSLPLRHSERWRIAHDPRIADKPAFLREVFGYLRVVSIKGHCHSAPVASQINVKDGMILIATQGQAATVPTFGSETIESGMHYPQLYSRFWHC